MDFELPENQLSEFMAIKPLTREQIARNEKKMNMTLDDIIKMSKKSTSNPRKPRASNKLQKFPNSSAAERNSSNVQRFMDSRASVRQGVLAQRRSNIQNRQLCSTIAIAKKAAAAPIRNKRMVHWSKPRVGTSLVQRRNTEGVWQRRQVKELVSKQWRPWTSESRFANMEEKRIEVAALRNNRAWNVQRGANQHQQRGRIHFNNMEEKRIEVAALRNNRAWNVQRGANQHQQLGRIHFNNWTSKSIRTRSGVTM